MAKGRKLAKDKKVPKMAPLRLDPDLYELIRKAARLELESANNFIVKAARDRMKAVLQGKLFEGKKSA